MSLGISRGQRARMAAITSIATFFHSVCQLLSTSASPKHPQSWMGSANASQSVNSVIRAIISSTTFDTSLRLMAKSRQMPRMNSVADNNTEAESVSRSGTSPPSPIAVR